MQNSVETESVRKVVRERYATIASGQNRCCCDEAGPSQDAAESCCSPADPSSSVLPEPVDLGLGCGDPVADADLLPGHIVLDLGSGAGMDAFLAARRVGPSGFVVGLDLTAEMVSRARQQRTEGGWTNVDFLAGEIENLPISSGSVDRIISNCVINLCPDKKRVFSEVYRVLKLGGSLTVSDIVSLAEVPPEIQADLEAWACCLGGAVKKQDYLEMIRSCGFRDVRLVRESLYRYESGEDLPELEIASITVRAAKAW